MESVTGIVDACECPVCLCPFTSWRAPLVLPQCGHSLCSQCAPHLVQSHGHFHKIHYKCPVCRANNYALELCINRKILFFAETLHASSAKSVATALKALTDGTSSTPPVDEAPPPEEDEEAAALIQEIKELRKTRDAARAECHSLAHRLTETDKGMDTLEDEYARLVTACQMANRDKMVLMEEHSHLYHAVAWQREQRMRREAYLRYRILDLEMQVPQARVPHFWTYYSRMPSQNP